MTKTSTGAKPERPTSKRSRHPVDENLRRVYEDMVEEEVPDKFAELLRQLREQDGA